MSVLSDWSILKSIRDESIKIDPFYQNRIQPTSYDVSLGREFRIFNRNCAVIDTKDVDPELTQLTEAAKMVLMPNDFILASTEEYIELGDRTVARLEGKSSLGRLGLVVHSTAGWIDPGFKGNITLELSNNSPLPLILYAGMLIGQLAFMTVTTPVSKPYGSEGLNSRYQNSKGTIESRF